MARYKTSGIISEIRGKLNNDIYSRNHSGTYIKGMFTPPDIQSPIQLQYRAKFAELSASWKNLTEDERHSWRVEQTNSFKTNIFGDQYNSSAFHLFLSRNLNLYFANCDLINSPVQNSSTGSIDKFYIYRGILHHRPINIGFDNLAVDDDCRYLVFATAGLSAGIYFVRAKYRMIDIIPESTVDGWDVDGQYLSHFPRPAVGSKVFFLLKPINIYSGIAGNSIQSSFIYTL